MTGLLSEIEVACSSTLEIFGTQKDTASIRVKIRSTSTSSFSDLVNTANLPLLFFFSSESRLL